MKNKETEGSVTSDKSLFQLVKLICKNARSSALNNNSFIVNDVPEEIRQVTDEHILASVLSKLLYSIVDHSANSCIRVTANMDEENVFVSFRSTFAFNENTLEMDLQQSQALAKKINGNLGINKEDRKITGIVFSFPKNNFSNN